MDDLELRTRPSDIMQHQHSERLNDQGTAMAALNGQSTRYALAAIGDTVNRQQHVLDTGMTVLSLQLEHQSPKVARRGRLCLQSQTPQGCTQAALLPATAQCLAVPVRHQV